MAALFSRRDGFERGKWLAGGVHPAPRPRYMGSQSILCVWWNTPPPEHFESTYTKAVIDEATHTIVIQVTDTDRPEGRLSVSKIVSGSAGSTAKAFSLSVTLADRSIRGEYGNMGFVDGAANFALKHVESLAATGLPAGVAYTVSAEKGIRKKAALAQVVVAMPWRRSPPTQAKTKRFDASVSAHRPPNGVWGAIFDDSDPCSCQIQIGAVPISAGQGVGHIRAAVERCAVRHRDDRDSPVAQAAKELLNLPLVGGVQLTGGLIQQNHRGPPHQALGNGGCAGARRRRCSIRSPYAGVQAIPAEHRVQPHHLQRGGSPSSLTSGLARRRLSTTDPSSRKGSWGT